MRQEFKKGDLVSNNRGENFEIIRILTDNSKYPVIALNLNTNESGTYKENGHYHLDKDDNRNLFSPKEVFTKGNIIKNNKRAFLITRVLEETFDGICVWKNGTSNIIGESGSRFLKDTRPLIDETQYKVVDFDKIKN